MTGFELQISDSDHSALCDAVNVHCALPLQVKFSVSGFFKKCAITGLFITLLSPFQYSSQTIIQFADDWNSNRWPLVPEVASLPNEPQLLVIAFKQTFGFCCKRGKEVSQKGKTILSPYYWNGWKRKRKYWAKWQTFHLENVQRICLREKWKKWNWSKPCCFPD